MSTLDRYILRGLITNYLIAIGVMISLYVVLDLFFNMDEFTESGHGVARLVQDIVGFYGTRVFQYFEQLSGVITLFACLLTLARMRRQNELTAMLASGVSLYRVAAPVIGFALLTTTLWYVDTEVIIPSVADKLARRHDDAQGLRTYGVWFLRDRDDQLLSALQYLPEDETLKRVLVIKRDDEGALHSVIQADFANWKPPDENGHPGRWQLERGLRFVPHQDDLRPVEAEVVTEYVSDLDPQMIEMRQSAGWINFLSYRRLNELGQVLSGQQRDQARMAKHLRVTKPLVNLLMLLLGLPFILSRLPANLLASAGSALLTCGACYLATFVSQNLGSAGGALPAWIPLLVFTPIAAVLLDRMKT